MYTETRHHDTHVNVHIGGKKKQGSWLTQTSNVTFIMCSIVCVCVPPMKADTQVSFTTSPSCSNTQSAAFCDLLPSMSPSAPPTFPHLCSCPFSSLTLSSLHSLSYLSLCISSLCSVSCWTLLTPNYSPSSYQMSWALLATTYAMISSFVLGFIHPYAGPCVIPTVLETRSWKNK